MRGGREGDEELRPIGVLARIRHREEARGGMWEPDALIVEFVTVDGLAASAILVGDVTALHHEALDDPVEDVALVMKSLTLLTCADNAEILCSLRDLLGEQLETTRYVATQTASVRGWLAYWSSQRPLGRPSSLLRIGQTPLLPHSC